MYFVFQLFDRWIAFIQKYWKRADFMTALSICLVMHVYCRKPQTHIHLIALRISTIILTSQPLYTPYTFIMSRQNSKKKKNVTQDVMLIPYMEAGEFTFRL